MAGNIHSAYARHGSLSYLIETGKSFQPSTEKEVRETVNRVWGSVKYLLSLGGEVRGVVRGEIFLLHFSVFFSSVNELRVELGVFCVFC
jgi:hypothetical protein